RSKSCATGWRSSARDASGRAGRWTSCGSATGKTTWKSCSFNWWRDRGTGEPGDVSPRREALPAGRASHRGFPPPGSPGVLVPPPAAAAESPEGAPEAVEAGARDAAGVEGVEAAGKAAEVGRAGEAAVHAIQVQIAAAVGPAVVAARVAAE